MGLWMCLLLLRFHLGVCAPLPAPSNVSISSFNMLHTLSFLPGPQTPPDTHFTVQIFRFRKETWSSVAGCLELMAGQTCNLTRAFKDPYDLYQARVRAFTPTQTSNWTISGQFEPITDTVLGPLDVSVSGCGNCLLVQVSVPKKHGQLLQSLYRQLHLHVRRTWDGIQFKLNLPYKEESMITYLQPGVEYCVTVYVKGHFNSDSVPSKPFCTFTSPPPTSSLNVVFGLLGAFCVLGFLLIGLVIYGGQRNDKLPRRLSYIELQSQDRGSAASELSDQTSAHRIHKRGSAEHLHGPQLRPSTEEQL